MVVYRRRSNLFKQRFGGEPVCYERILSLEVVAKAQDQSLSNRKQPWYHTSTLSFVASWMMSNEVIQKLEYLHFLYH